MKRGERIVRLVLMVVAGLWITSGTTALAARLYLAGSNTFPQQINPELGLGVGDSGSLWLWLDPEGEVINGLGHSIVTNPAGALLATDYVLENPTVVGLSRWNGTSVGTLNSLVADASAVAVSGATGINADLAPLDPMYDSASGSFRVARIDFRVVLPPPIEIYLEVGTAKITSTISTPASPVMVKFGFGDPAVAGNIPGTRSTHWDARIVEVCPENMNLSYHADLLDCLEGPGAGFEYSACRCFDFDGDGDVDLGDWAVFQNLFGGEPTGAITIQSGVLTIVGGLFNDGVIAGDFFSES